MKYISKKDEIKEYIINEILKGNLKENDRINDRKFFVSKFRVNPSVVDDALRGLLDNGILKLDGEFYAIGIGSDRLDALRDRYLNIYINELLVKTREIGISDLDVVKALNLRNMANG